MIPIIAVGFVLLGALLLWLVIGGRGAWWLKLGAIVATCAFTFAVWSALGSFSGWATDATPPARALVVSSTVDEPRAIYVWLIAPTKPGLLGYRAEKAEPRAYRLPYSRELHEEIDRGTALARRGQPVELSRREVEGSGGGRRTRLVVRAYRLPPQSLPRKDGAQPMDAPE
jgi:hypothetical protein